MNKHTKDCNFIKNDGMNCLVDHAPGYECDFNSCTCNISNKENNWEEEIREALIDTLKYQEFSESVERIHKLLTQAIQEERERILQKVNRMNWFEYPDDCLKELKQYLSKINKE